jgi:hypothetical protein
MEAVMRTDKHTTHEWLQVASVRVIADTGYLTKSDRAALDRDVRLGKIAKWRGRWFPNPGAPWGIGPLKTCYGPHEAKECFDAVAGAAGKV